MSMSAIPVVVDHDAKTSSWVFEDSEIQEFVYPEGKSVFDPDVELTPNPAYRPDLDVNFANGNAHRVMDAIGLGERFEEGFGYEVAIDDFIAAAGRALAQLTGTGTSADVHRRIARILVAATEGRQRGATHLMLA